MDTVKLVNDEYSPGAAAYKMMKIVKSGDTYTTSVVEEFE